MSGGPIFIGGLAFSGKTPLRIALAAHPRIAMTRRTAMWERFNGSFGDLRRRENLDRCLDTMLADPSVAELGLDRERLVSELAAGPAEYLRLFGLMHAQHAQLLGKARWGDQMGALERSADRVLAAFPDAYMVHMIRDPRTRYIAAAGRHRQRPGKLGWETARWLRSVELAQRNQRRYPDRYRVVRYEQLADDPDRTLRDVTAFVDEEYDPAMADALVAVSPSTDGAAGHSAITHCSGAAAFIDRYAGAQLAVFGYAIGNSRSTQPRFMLGRMADRAGLAVGRAAGSFGPGRLLNVKWSAVGGSRVKGEGWDEPTKARHREPPGGLR